MPPVQQMHGPRSPADTQQVNMALRDQKSAISAADAILRALSYNPVYIKTYGKLFNKARSLALSGHGQSYMFVPKIQEAAKYMQEKHPRLYSLIKKQLNTLESSMLPPLPPHQVGLFNRLKNWWRTRGMPEEPRPYDAPERVFEGVRKFVAQLTGVDLPKEIFDADFKSVEELIELILKEVEKMKEDGIAPVDIELSVLRKHGPEIHKEVFESDDDDTDEEEDGDDGSENDANDSDKDKSKHDKKGVNVHILSGDGVDDNLRYIRFRSRPVRAIKSDGTNVTFEVRIGGCWTRLYSDKQPR